MTACQLQSRLRKEIGAPVRLTVTENRTNMVSFSKKNTGVYYVRVHKIYLDAPETVIDGVVAFVKKPGKRTSQVILDYAGQQSDSLHRIPRRKRAVNVITEGRTHDLQPMFERINKRYFQGKCDCIVTWGKQAARRKGRRSIRFGSYEGERNTIRIHPLLDSPSVPDYVVASILYHEMLHWYIPPVKNSGRRIVHSKLFRQAEQAYPDYAKAAKWKEENLLRLLNS